MILTQKKPMHSNSTLENYLNKLQKQENGWQNKSNPSQQVIQNILAYSKAFIVLKNPLDKCEKRKVFQFILN